MHCAKVTGTLLSEERLFREYLVPFRRSPPPASAASQTNSTATATPATSSAAEGRREDRVELPPALVSPAVSPAPTTKKDADATKSPGLSPSSGNTEGESRGSDSQSVKPNGLGRSRAGSEGGPPGASSSGRGGSTSPIRALNKATPRSAKPGLEGGADNGVGTAPAVANTGSIPVRVTEQEGPRGEGALQDVLLWNESAVAKSMGCRCVCLAWGREACVVFGLRCFYGSGYWNLVSYAAKKRPEWGNQKSGFVLSARSSTRKISTHVGVAKPMK